MVLIDFVVQWSYASLLREGVPKEPSLDEASANITKHYTTPEGQQAWPFMDFIKVEGDYTIAPDVPAAAHDLADFLLLHQRLRGNDELSEALTRLEEISLEISKIKAMEKIIMGILKSRKKYA